MLNFFGRSAYAEGGGSGHFTFGQNWRRYIDGFLDDQKIAHATAQTSAFLGVGDLSGRRFIDVGCGSGLFSCVAHHMGAAEIISFDVDPDSVVATRRIFERAGSPPNCAGHSRVYSRP